MVRLLVTSLLAKKLLDLLDRIQKGRGKTYSFNIIHFFKKHFNLKKNECSGNLLFMLCKTKLCSYRDWKHKDF